MNVINWFKTNHLKFILFTSICLFFLFTYSNKIHFNQIRFYFDADYIIFPFFKIHTLQDYFTAIKNFKVLDLQPIRDISTVIDIYFFRILRINTFLISSLIIFFISSFYIYLILRQLCILLKKNIEDKIILLFVLAFLAHPTFHHSILWLTQKKHLLAMMFALISIYYFLKLFSTNKGWMKFISILSFVFSLLANPVFIFAPIWFSVIDFVISNRKLIKSIYHQSLYFIISFIIGSIHYLYYNKFLYSITLDKQGFSLDRFDFLIIGRSLGQFLFPISHAIHFFEQNYLNFVGILLLLFFLITLFFFPKNRKWILAFLSGPILVVLTFILNSKKFYLVDPYLFLPISIYLITTFIFFISVDNNNIKRLMNIICLFFIALFAFKSIEISNNFSHQPKYFQEGFYKEGGCLNLKYLLTEIFEQNINSNLDNKKNFQSVMKCTQQLDISNIELTFPKNGLIYFTSSLNFDEKFILLNKSPLQSIPILPILGLMIQNNKNNLSVKISEFIRQIKELPEDYLLKILVFYQGPMEQLNQYCQKNIHQDCAVILKLYSNFIFQRNKQAHFLQSSFNTESDY